ncbi:MAG: AZOBR_p60025 family cell surface glycopolymer formation protein [Actinomycetota bacterium]
MTGVRFPSPALMSVHERADPRPTGSNVAWICGGVAFLVCLLAVLVTISVRHYRVTALIRMSPSEPMSQLAKEADSGFAFVHPDGHYDGVYFYANALDPFATGAAHELIDQPSYRYGHVGYGWVAWLASLGGRASLVPVALLLIGLLSMAGAAYYGSVLAEELGWSPWGGLLVAFNPGLIYAVTVDTAEPLGTLLLLGTLLAWIRGRRWLAAVLIVGLCFVKEPLVLVPIGLGLWELVMWARREKEAFGALVLRVAPLALGPILYVGWNLYLKATFGEFPFQQGQGNLAKPLFGWLDTLQMAASMGMETFDRMQLGTAAVPLITAAFVALVLGVYRSLAFKSPVDAVFLVTGLLMLSLGWLALLYPKELIRNLAFTFVLLPAVLLRPRFEPWKVPEDVASETKQTETSGPS